MMLDASLRMFAATLIAPLAAPISIVFALGLLEGSAEMALLAPLTLVTIPGIYGYALAFIPVLLLGTGLTVASLHFPVLRPAWIWLATGAFFGTLMGMAIAPGGRDMLAYGAVAGSACALVYRVIVGPALRRPAATPSVRAGS